MILSQTIATEAEIRVLDVKCHVSVGKEQNNFQIGEVRVAGSTCAEISGSAESLQFESVMSCSATTIGEPVAAFVPVLRSGSFADIGCRDSMDDEHICIDDLSAHLGSNVFNLSVPCAFYGVFDGHGGPEAALYMKENATRLFFHDADFPEMPSIMNAVFLKELENSHRKAYLLADLAMADESIVNGSCGTTSLTALVIGQHLLVANTGDCRAVLSRKGVAVEMSFDHRSTFEPERKRVQDLGGYFEDGYLNGVLAITRALGDWEMKKFPPFGTSSPLIPEPDVQQIILGEEDEFLILGCDGIWDVMSSQYAVSLVRQGLRRHDDPRKCAMELVKEAMRLDSSDNLTAVVVCFSAVKPLTQPTQRRKSRFFVSDEARVRLQALLGGN
ncbi:PREDICTED: probable protein phosphatase 2C 13 [Tarenaya hassleriana]|uniref:probable protein phosphatase 2C 13 n=1 Tax=Tarenaya hassleriana TaxID=28532 RepID=UPI00053C87F1|nr:PREDICTED: probable protein phosphatase 2C 13 [Tarenaya hassleriana]